MRYGSRIKEWITDHDIKQKALAKEFHITESMMSHYMTGRNEITVDLLVKFAQKYGLSRPSGKVRAKIWAKYRLLGGAFRQPPPFPGAFPHRRKTGAGFPHPYPGSAGADCAERGDYEGTKREIKHGRSGGTARVFVL